MRRRAALPLLLLVVTTTTMTATPSLAAVVSTVDQGVLTIVGDAEDDHIAISCSPGGAVHVNGGDPDTGAAACADVTAIDVRAGAGADDVDLGDVSPTTFRSLVSVSIDAGEGDDDIHGSHFPDSIVGGSGADQITANVQGRDVVDGGDGRDHLRTGLPRDVTITDSAFTSSGGSVPLASIESIFAVATPEADVVDARSYSGSFAVRGRDGEDRLLGGTGTNSLAGGAADDVLVGGPGQDELIDDEGDDRVSGARGKDVFYNGRGSDRLRGGSGGDTFFEVLGRRDRMVGGSGLDRISVHVHSSVTLTDVHVRIGRSSAFLRSIETASVQVFDSTLAGMRIDARRFSGRTSLEGDHGDDVLLGGSGEDSIIGWGGDDVLSGGAGNDRLYGEDGHDTCDGGPGVDAVDGCESFPGRPTSMVRL